MIKNFYWSSCYVPLFLSYFNETLIFFDRFSKNSQTSNFLKIRSLGAEFFHVDGQVDRYDEANGRFSQFFESA